MTGKGRRQWAKFMQGSGQEREGMGGTGPSQQTAVELAPWKKQGYVSKMGHCENADPMSRAVKQLAARHISTGRKV